jgi:hypothetical protein
MIETQEGLVVSQQQLARLRAMEERAVNDPNLHPRLKESKLAGIRGMITQIEEEIRVYRMSHLPNSINEKEIPSE